MAFGPPLGAASCPRDGSGRAMSEQPDDCHGDEAEAEEDEETLSEAEGVSEAESTSVIDEGDARVPNGMNGEMYSADVIVDEFFKDLCLPADTVRAVQEMWARFLQSAESVEAAADAVYSAVFDSAPNLQSMFTSPRAVYAVKFMNGISQIIGALHAPKALRVLVESMAFQHLSRDVTPPRIVVFRDAIVDLLIVESGDDWTPQAELGLKTALNYAGGAFIYFRRHYAERIQLLSSSWEKANRQKEQDHESTSSSRKKTGKKAITVENSAKSKRAKSPKSLTPTQSVIHSPRRAHRHRRKMEEAASAVHSKGGSDNVAIPTTFREMFRFNATVMGFADCPWMLAVLDSLHDIVVNIANCSRLQEECDVLSLRMCKQKGTLIDLADFKAILLASLRSLLPTDWDSQHEVAWCWLWENVESLLKSQLGGKLDHQERALARFMASIDDDMRMICRQQLFLNLFEIAPKSVHYLKQSTTRLHFIADKVFSMSLDMYRHPEKTSFDLSALGLRHVGYGIPPELVAPFVCASISVIRNVATDEVVVDAFRWSMSLISRSVVRVMAEGSTLVMKAINANSAKQVVKAADFAARSRRADSMLKISVGAESISPLAWAIKTGKFDAARAIIEDLTVVRADRDRYYFGVDALFERHPDIIRMLCTEAPTLLPTLFDGMIWRSRFTESGGRKAIYFLKHLVMKSDETFSQAIEWISAHGNPQLVRHPIVSYSIDLVWSRIAIFGFFARKAHLLLTIVIYVLSQSILMQGLHQDVPNHTSRRIAVCVCRCIIYLFAMPVVVWMHFALTIKDLRQRAYVRFLCTKLPAHFAEGDSIFSLALCFILPSMLALDPLLHCFLRPEGGDGILLAERCPASDEVGHSFSFLSMCGTLCYFCLLLDFSVLSNRFAAFGFVIFRTFSELALFTCGLAFVTLAFCCGITALNEDDDDFRTIPHAAKAFLQMLLSMASSDQYDHLASYMTIFIGVCFFKFVTTIYLVNFLVAQLACAYAHALEDMAGFAYLRRGQVCVMSMLAVSPRRWRRFVESLRLSDPCPFAEGDVGMPGGLQVFEPANAHLTTMDTIRRYGGTTDPEAVWPEDDSETVPNVEERLEKVERCMKKMMKKMDRVLGQRRRSCHGVSGSSVMDDLASSHTAGSSASSVTSPDE